MALASSSLLGGPDLRLPPVVDVSALFEYSNVSLILNLSAHALEERGPYVKDPLQALGSLRGRRGRPNCFVIDELHSFCRREGGPLTDLMLGYMREGGFGVLTYRPSLVAPAVLGVIDKFLLTRLRMPEERELIQRHLHPSCRPDASEVVTLGTLPLGQALLSAGERMGGNGQLSRPVWFQVAPRSVTHVRHPRSIAHSGPAQRCEPAGTRSALGQRTQQGTRLQRGRSALRASGCVLKEGESSATKTHRAEAPV